MDNEELTNIRETETTPLRTTIPAQEFQQPQEQPPQLPEDEDDDSLPFPNARVVRMIREEIQSGKQIRGEVKTAANLWLGELLCKLTREMDRSPYGSIGLADFQRATRPFDMIDHLVKDKERVMLAIDKLMADADQIKRDLQRFYENLTGEEQQDL